MPAKRCGRCGASYDHEAWGALRVVDRLAAARVRGLVVGEWPEGMTIDVRECRTCAAPVARIAREARGATPQPSPVRQG